MERSAKPFVSVQVNVAGASFAPAFEQLRRQGLTGVQSLSLDWSRVEGKPTVFENPFPAIANAFYPVQGTQVLLVLRPLNTVRYEVPPDLKGMAFDDPKLLARFEKQLDWVLAQLPKTDLAGIALGNEIGGVLGDDTKAWAAYVRFFSHMSAYVRAKRAHVPVGVCVEAQSWLGSQRRYLEMLHTSADQLFLNYYPLRPDFTVKPLAEARRDLDRLIGLASKPLTFTEIGCPSSPQCQSSEAQQAAFVTLVRERIGAAGNRVTGALFQWYRDNAEAEVEEQVRYYGVTTPGFRGFLASLGMSTAPGREKQALKALLG